MSSQRECLAVNEDWDVLQVLLMQSIRGHFQMILLAHLLGEGIVKLYWNQIQSYTVLGKPISRWVSFLIQFQLRVYCNRELTKLYCQFGLAVAATLVGDFIYIIGALGYPDSRKHDFTPVYRLSLEDYSIECVETSGSAPGWIYRHRAILQADNVIRISGGLKEIKGKGEVLHIENQQTYELDLIKRLWTAV